MKLRSSKTLPTPQTKTSSSQQGAIPKAPKKKLGTRVQLAIKELEKTKKEIEKETASASSSHTGSPTYGEHNIEIQAEIHPNPSQLRELSLSPISDTVRYHSGENTDLPSDQFSKVSNQAQVGSSTDATSLGLLADISDQTQTVPSGTETPSTAKMIVDSVGTLTPDSEVVVFNRLNQSLQEIDSQDTEHNKLSEELGKAAESLTQLKQRVSELLGREEELETTIPLVDNETSQTTEQGYTSATLEGRQDTSYGAVGTKRESLTSEHTPELPLSSPAQALLSYHYPGKIFEFKQPKPETSEPQSVGIPVGSTNPFLPSSELQGASTPLSSIDDFWQQQLNALNSHPQTPAAVNTSQEQLNQLTPTDNNKTVESDRSSTKAQATPVPEETDQYFSLREQLERELQEYTLVEQELHLFVRFPGQNTNFPNKRPTRELFEYCYFNPDDQEVQRFLREI